MTKATDDWATFSHALTGAGEFHVESDSNVSATFTNQGRWDDALYLNTGLCVGDEAMRYRVLRIVTDEPGADSELIAGQLGISDKRAYDLVAYLRREGLLAPL